MTKYYCIVFLDKREEVLRGEVTRHTDHGAICGAASVAPMIFTDKDEAERIFYDRWHAGGDRWHGGECWKGCYELWEFEV